ncbi:uncharacterized protein LOC142172079 [Nicotiana tabacum]|uniref:Uncharacterized protein LOC142172079 n=1 Tax=Nicotiana tabacum TaxID=4097 RepID=A0AC58T3Y8_TOBAC
MEVSGPHEEIIPSSIEDILLENAEVFLEPTKLPPIRSCDHAIELILGSTPVNQRPYRYSHEQKDVIEKMIQEILEAKTVKHSTSPFTSPVILVKKKDSTWILCVDYRRLNDITIKNTYPIPVVEDLLDELHELCSNQQTFNLTVKNGGFLWSDKATEGFEALKIAMTQAPILALPNFKLPFVVEVDATQPKWVQEVLDSYKDDPEVQELITKLSIDPHAESSVALQAGGHSGIHATYQRLKAIFYWTGMIKGVKVVVHECEVCQRNKEESVAYPGLLQPLPFSKKAWEHISIDFIKELPKSQRKEVILTVIDRFTKYAHFIAVLHPYNAAQIAQIFLDHICKLHGAPCSIVSDRDTIFVSLCMTCQKPKEWSKWLPMAEFWYNTNFQSAINMTPFKALYGYEPPLPTFKLVAQSKVEAVDQLLKDRQIVNKQLKENLVKAQIRMKQYADNKRSE